MQPHDAARKRPTSIVPSSTRGPGARAESLPRGIAKQHGRACEQRDEYPMHQDDLHGAGGVWHQEGDRAYHGLRQRRHEQRACQSTRLKARDERADASDGEHPDIQDVGAVVVLYPDEAGGSGERKAESNRYAVVLWTCIGPPRWSRQRSRVVNAGGKRTPHRPSYKVLDSIKSGA